MEEEVNYLIELDDDKRKEYIIDLLNKLYTDSYCQIIFAKKIFYKLNFLLLEFFFNF